MRRIVQLKTSQHPQIARLLASTADCELVFAFPDPFWGLASDGRGLNWLGCIWEEERTRLRTSLPATAGSPRSPRAPLDGEATYHGRLSGESARAM